MDILNDLRYDLFMQSEVYVDSKKVLVRDLNQNTLYDWEVKSPASPSSSGSRIYRVTPSKALALLILGRPDVTGNFRDASLKRFNPHCVDIFVEMSQEEIT